MKSGAYRFAPLGEHSPSELQNADGRGGQDRGIPRDQPRDVAQRRPGDREQGARAAARQAAPQRVGDLLPAHACAYHFFRVISLRTSSSRSRSATIFFRRPFSCSSLSQPLDVGRLQRAEVLPPPVDRLAADAP